MQNCCSLLKDSRPTKARLSSANIYQASSIFSGRNNANNEIYQACCLRRLQNVAKFLPTKLLSIILNETGIHICRNNHLL